MEVFETFYCGACGQSKSKADQHKIKLLSKPVCTACKTRLANVDGIGLKNSKSTRNTRTTLKSSEQ